MVNAIGTKWGSDDCALCKLFNNENGCLECPIVEHGYTRCGIDGSVYNKIVKSSTWLQWYYAASDVITLLENVLKIEESQIENVLRLEKKILIEKIEEKKGSVMKIINNTVKKSVTINSQDILFGTAFKGKIPNTSYSGTFLKIGNDRVIAIDVINVKFAEIWNKPIIIEDYQIVNLTITID